MAPTPPKTEKHVTRNDNRIPPKAVARYEPTCTPKSKPQRKVARKSKIKVGLESRPKLACVTPELIKALNHVVCGFTLASDRRVIRDFFHYHWYQSRENFGLRLRIFEL